MKNTLPLGRNIVLYHDHCLNLNGWPSQRGFKIGSFVVPEIKTWISENHRQNGLLWNQEDLARRKTVSDSDIASNKRAIDQHNQLRNDAIERIDEILLTKLGLLTTANRKTNSPIVKPTKHARLNSETAGSMIDRMSILSLKIKAMLLQSLRQDESAEFRSACHEKCERLIRQRNDLANCFDELLSDTANGTAWFQVYRQFKMYNDARLNPALVAESSS